MKDLHVSYSQGCLLLIGETRAKQKVYVWVSVWWRNEPKIECDYLVYTRLFYFIMNQERKR
jgi:hypothetical protein